MKYSIHKDIESLAVPIDDLEPWEKNPHEGDVEAIMASYLQFGQVKPIVVHAEKKTSKPTIIAGNHSTEAARRLGWTHIAVINFKGTREEAIAFALADNRTTELGRNDPVLLHETIVSVSEAFPEMFDALGWDEFQRAAMDEHVDYLTEIESAPTGYVAPVMIAQPGDPLPASEAPAPVRTIEDNMIVASPTMDQHEAITRGSTSVGAAGAKAVVQYMLVFDNAEQQRRWYDFMRWLRADPGTAGDTNAERLLDFLEARADF
jgi:ParB family chromosome partitioning protein